MKCPRCAGMLNASGCASCGFRHGDEVPMSAEETNREQVLTYLNTHRPDLASAFRSGETVNRDEIRTAATDEAVASMTRKLKEDRPDLAELLASGKTVKEVVSEAVAASHTPSTPPTAPPTPPTVQ